MRPGRFLLAIALLVVLVGRGAAQESVPVDSVRAQIRQTLRAFYFSLAHRDWEALTSDILAAKVVAHHTPPPEAAPVTRAASGCAEAGEPMIDRSTIDLNGEWALVLVPRCLGSLAQGDRFRLIDFERRWRFVSIDLWEDPVKLWAER